MVITKHLGEELPKLPVRHASMLLLILESRTPVSQEDIERILGIKQGKVSDIAKTFRLAGVITGTENEDGKLAYVPTDKGLAISQEIAERLSKGT